MHPRSDLKDGIGWIVLGTAILVASLRMDRLEQQHINPYTVPGLLPGLLGIAMILLGGVLALRSWRRGALAHALPPMTADEREQRKRIWIVTGLCMLYGVVLVVQTLQVPVGGGVVPPEPTPTAAHAALTAASCVLPAP